MEKEVLRDSQVLHGFDVSGCEEFGLQSDGTGDLREEFEGRNIPRHPHPMRQSTLWLRTALILKALHV